MDEKDRRQRPFELTRGAQLRSRAASRRAIASNNDNYFCALVMACTEVDYQRLRDRPGGTLDGWPDRAAGVSYAPALQGVARAAPRTGFLVPAPRGSAVAATGNPAL